MNTRSLLSVCFAVVMISSASGGFILQQDRSQKTAASVEPADKPSQVKAGDSSKDALGKEKTRLNRLVTELNRSPRSFVYLRSAGFTESDQEFAEIIAKNNSMFRSIRIIRRDEQGNRQIPGWPGIALTPEYKKLHR